MDFFVRQNLGLFFNCDLMCSFPNRQRKPKLCYYCVMILTLMLPRQGHSPPVPPPPLAAKNITNDNTNQSLSLQLPGLTRQHVSYCLSRLTVQLSEPHSLSLFVIGEHPFIWMNLKRVYHNEVIVMHTQLNSVQNSNENTDQWVSHKYSTTLTSLF